MEKINVTPEMYMKAWETTGLTPLFDEWKHGNCACGMVALAISIDKDKFYSKLDDQDSYHEIIKEITGLSCIEIDAFTIGFDGCGKTIFTGGEDERKMYEIGRTVRSLVKSKTDWNMVK